jgi:serine/threonine-protein kinase
LRAACPAHVADVVLRALAKDKSARFASMDEIARALERDAASPKRRSLALALSFALAAMAVLAGYAALRARTPSSASAAAPSASQPAPAPTRITDLPLPSSDMAEARSAYVAGMHALRGGSIVPAVKSFLRATELDPSMAAAHLRLITHGRSISETNEQPHFAKARELRTMLTPRDQALLDALEPSFLTMPPDESEVSRRIRALAARYPLDAELAYLSAAREPDPEKAGALYDRVLELDPEFALALWRKANAYLLVSDFPKTIDALDRCVAIASSSTSCLTVRALVNEELGRCEQMEKDARALEYVSPSARTHDLLARVLYANGAPMTAVKEALERKWAAAGDQREAYELDDRAHAAILEGDFALAEKITRDAAKRVERSPIEDDHKNTVVPLVDVLDEMGETARAAREAEQYLTARAAWKPLGAWSPLPKMYAFAVRAKLRSAADRDGALDAWRRLWDDAEPSMRSQWWVIGFAVPAMDEADAKHALEIAPKPLPRVHTNQFHREGMASVGKVLLFAGRAEEALPLLRTAAASCSALQAPIDHTRANLYLGQALERTGDATGACAAYKIVLARWGKASPRSVTADQARARVAALRCR